MRVTSKGQVTIPIALRQKLGLRTNTEVEFTLVGDSIRIRKARPGHRRLREAIERMVGSATSGLTTDEILRLTRGEE